MPEQHTLTVHPVTPGRWPDLLALFGDRGAYYGCWCTWFRQKNSAFAASKSVGHREEMTRLVATGREPGLLAYDAGRPVGWISVAPRDEFERISGDGDAARDGAADAAIWSVVCFYVDKRQRRRGVSTALVDAAIAHARERGASVLEAYPIDKDGPIDSASAYLGLRSWFERAGFTETGRFDRWASIPEASGEEPRPLQRPPGRPVMRLELGSVR